jgi:RNA polymerase sigma-70 factor (ECF subfamily)
MNLSKEATGSGATGLDRADPDTAGYASEQVLSKQEWADCMKQVQRRDKQAFAMLFKYFSPRLKHFLFKKLGNEQIAMELVQEAMSTVWQKAHMFDASKSSLSTWIYTIARNLCFDLMRKQKGKEVSIQSQDIWPTDNLAADMVDQYSPEQTVLKQQVLKFLDTLPDNQRDVVKAVYLDEISQQEAAERFDLPLGTVKSRLRLAVEKLKQTMQSERL